MKITFVAGGARSGKSSFALGEASKAEGRKAYIATAEPLDEEMRERIHKHQAERGSEWDTFEEPLKLPEILKHVEDTHSVAVLDCLTVWLSNLLLQSQIRKPGQQTTEERMHGFLNNLRELKDLDLFIVANEVGMGIVPENKISRKFRDLAGMLNQKVAGIADEMYLVVAGMPLKIK